MSALWFDDLQAGLTFTTRGVTLTEAQIVQFAFDYDPQPFHMDAQAAAQSQFGGLVASGIHSLAVACRLVQHDKPWGPAAMGGPGMSALRWLRPVRPGDTLHVVGEVKSVRLSSSKPDRGLVETLHSVYNQHDELVMDYTLTEMVARRPAEGAPA